MEATKILSSEHRVIEVVIDCMVKMTDKALAESKLDGQSAREAVDFIRTFADQCHHGKEEDILFVEMVAKGMPSDSGPIGVMLSEHVMGRNFVKGMSENIDAAAAGDESAVKAFAENAKGYAALLRAHIKKEDDILYPMAEQTFNEDEQKKMLESFHHVEKDHMGEGTHEKYLKLAKSLAEKFGVPTDQISESFHSCGH